MAHLHTLTPGHLDTGTPCDLAGLGAAEMLTWRRVQTLNVSDSPTKPPKSFKRDV